MKNKIKIILIVLLLLISPLVKAKTLVTYNSATSSTNNYINKFKNYQNFIVQDNSKYSYNGSTFESSEALGLKKSGFLNLFEFKVSKNEEGDTYLFNGLKYWTMTSGTGGKYVISPESPLKYIVSPESNDNGVRYTQYILDCAVIEGKGTYTQPWKLIESDDCPLEPSTSPNCFAFNSTTGTITDYYDYENNVSTNPVCPRDVVIPSKIYGTVVKAIGSSAFYNNQLISVEIPKSVVTITNNPFYANPTLTTFIVKNNPNYIVYNNAIYTADGATLVSGTQSAANNIKPTTKTIGSYAFASMQLTNVTFPVGVEIIGASAFQNNLFTTVNFPNTVININSHAFSSNQIGPTLTLPDSVETIVANSFYNNQPLVTVYIGTGLKTYGSESYNVFADIQGLPDGFDDPMGCASMNRWHDPFRLCINLEKIIVNVNNQNFKSINDNLYNKAGTWIVRATKTTTKIAYGTIGVNEYAFADLEINSILAIPDTLKYLASNSFDSFKSDKTIIFPNSLKIISTRSFYNTDVTISIGNGLDTVFSHCFDKRNTITINKKASQVKYYKNACDSFDKATVTFLPE